MNFVPALVPGLGCSIHTTCLLAESVFDQTSGDACELIFKSEFSDFRDSPASAQVFLNAATLLNCHFFQFQLQRPTAATIMAKGASGDSAIDEFVMMNLLLSRLSNKFK